MLRVYGRDRDACSKELAVASAARPALPVPEILYADADGRDAVGPHVVYRYAEGITFQELKAKGDIRELAAAAYAVGHVLARVRNVEVGSAVAADPCTDEWWSSELLEQRLGRKLRDRLLALITPDFSHLLASELLPDDWPVRARVISALSAARSLTRDDVAASWIPELCDLVIAGLDQRDPA